MKVFSNRKVSSLVTCLTESQGKVDFSIIFHDFRSTERGVREIYVAWHRHIFGKNYLAWHRHMPLIHHISMWSLTCMSHAWVCDGERLGALFSLAFWRDFFRLLNFVFIQSIFAFVSLVSNFCKSLSGLIKMNKKCKKLYSNFYTNIL